MALEDRTLLSLTWSSLGSAQLVNPNDNLGSVSGIVLGLAADPTNTTIGISGTAAYTDLRMDPTNHLKLFVAVGSDNNSKDGVYVTTDGGAT
jgi:hypothetical protein